MNHIGKRMLTLGLAAVITASVLPGAISASAATVDGTADTVAEYHGTESGPDIVPISELNDDQIISSVEEYSDFSDAPVVGSAASQLPSECDNSTNENSIYFPPIGDQGSVGSCACWSSTYYVYTYTAHRANGIPTTVENSFSPIWIYNLSNAGTNDGSNSPRNYRLISTLGAATIADVPAIDRCEPDYLIYDWHAENDIWKKASPNRLTSYGYFTPTSITDGYSGLVNTPVPGEGTPITSADDEDLIPMKTALSNGNILCFNSFIGGWCSRYIKQAPGVDNRFVGEKAVYGVADVSVGHAMTIVGYNDNIWVDVNNNNKIDEGEMGAFKIANSWGTYYGNNGFMWISYDSMNKVSSVENAPVFTNRQCSIDTVCTIKVDPKKYESDLYLKYVLNSAERANTHVYVTATEKANPSNTVTKLVAPYGLGDYVDIVDKITDHSYNGTTFSWDGQMYFDLNNVVPDISKTKLNNYNWKVTVKDTTNNDKSLIVRELKIVDDTTGGEHDLMNSDEVTLNGSSKTFNAGTISFPFSSDCTVSPSGILGRYENATIKATPKAGKAPYTYQYEMEHNGQKSLLMPFTSSNTLEKQFNETGTYDLIVTVKDADGNTSVVRKTVYVANTELSNLAPDVTNAVKGQTVVFTPQCSSLAEIITGSDFHYTVTKDGVSQTFTGNDKKQLVWTPEEGGDYTITCDIIYNSNPVASKTVNYTVSDNTVTIYYKGYSTPNIHFQVGDGSWTTVPGIAMTATGEVSGYTHKYTINLGDASYANVCFNDGNGSWDSRNGANYRFEKGTYKFSNGTITKFDPTPAGPEAALSVSKREALKNETVTLNGSATNGKAPYQYKLTYTLNGASYNYVDYSADSSFTFTPITNGNYEFKLTVKDANGKTATATKTLAVKTPSITSVNANPSSANAGETVKLSMTVADNMSAMTRSYRITKGDITNTMAADSTGALNWTPFEAGTYTITGILTYNGKTYNSSDITYTVTEAPANTVTIYYKGYSTPYIHYQVGSGSWTGVPGVPMTSTNEVSGYTHKYTINLGSASCANVCFNDGNGSWDSNNCANYRFEKGTYKYSNGTITKFEPTPAGISAALSLSKSEALKNETITLNASAANGKAPYQYKLTYTLNGTAHTVSDFGTASSFSFTPDTTGSYVFTLTAKDANGKTAAASKTLSVKSPSITSVNTDPSAAKVGESVKLTMNVADSMSAVMRSFVIAKDGATATLNANAAGEAYWVPAAAGTYTVTGILTYNGKTLDSSSVSCTVTQAPANTATIYYKGYATPYIHYQVGSGSWTAVPGVPMTATNEVSGCTHKYTINLGSASNATVCFNNGSGSWDSNNGANYRFEKGTYKFANGTITKFDPTPAGLTANLSLSKSEALKNETITLNGSAANGKAPYQYKLTYTLDGASYTLADFGTASGFSFTPIMNGSYTFTLTVKDADGKTATAVKSFAARTPSISSVSANPSSPKTGETVRLTMTVADSMSAMTRSYQVSKNGVTTTLNADAAGAANWTPSEAGTYTITGILTYNGKAYTSSSITYNVSAAPANTITIYYKGYSTPNIHYQVGSGSWTAVPGVPMTATNEVSGCTHKYTINLGSASYANVCFNDGNGNWDSRNGANYRFEKGTYRFANGTVTRM